MIRRDQRRPARRVGADTLYAPEDVIHVGRCRAASGLGGDAAVVVDIPGDCECRRGRVFQDALVVRECRDSACWIGNRGDVPLPVRTERAGEPVVGSLLQKTVNAVIGEGACRALATRDLLQEGTVKATLRERGCTWSASSPRPSPCPPWCCPILDGTAALRSALRDRWTLGLLHRPDVSTCGASKVIHPRVLADPCEPTGLCRGAVRTPEGPVDWERHRDLCFRGKMRVYSLRMTTASLSEPDALRLSAVPQLSRRPRRARTRGTGSSGPMRRQCCGATSRCAIRRGHRRGMARENRRWRIEDQMSSKWLRSYTPACRRGPVATGGLHLDQLAGWSGPATAITTWPCRLDGCLTRQPSWGQVQWS